jgi:PPOX class probable F420-dependent enzyme
MSLGERLAAASNRLTDRLRHRDAFASAAAGGQTGDLSVLQGHKHCLLTTFRRSGAPVPTPVWFGLAGGRAYARSEADAAKVRRIRSQPRVLVAPCDVRGKPRGPGIEARARVLDSGDEARAEAAIQANYGLGRRLYESGAGRLGVDLVYLEISPAEQASS